MKKALEQRDAVVRVTGNAPVHELSRETFAVSRGTASSAKQPAALTSPPPAGVLSIDGAVRSLVEKLVSELAQDVDGLLREHRAQTEEWLRELRRDIEHERNTLRGIDAEYLSTKQLARRLGVAERTVRRWIKDGRIQATRTPGGSLRVAARELDRIQRAVVGSTR